MALEELVAHGEEWLAGFVTADWGDRYGRPVRYDRLPRGSDALIAYVLRVGRDGMHILQAVHDVDAPPRLRALPAVEVLRQVWVQQYWVDEDGQLCWRRPKSSRDWASRRTTERRNTGNASAAGRPDPASARVPWSGMEIVTPHDPEARYSQKVTAAGQRDWIGYRDHQTETCDETSPNVIVQVTTRPAPEQDIDAVDLIHQGLTAQGFQPTEHVVDSGYISPDSIHHAARQRGIPLFGPVRDDPQAGKRPGFAKQDFRIDWQARTLTCPNGVTSPPWKPTLGDGHPRLSVLFPRNAEGKGRHVFLMPQPLQEIQTKARADQTTAEWRRRYAIRAGCEATVSETVHAHGLRNCRYRGMARTHVQHVPTAAGTNIVGSANTSHQASHRSADAVPGAASNNSAAACPPEDRQQHPEERSEPLSEILIITEDLRDAVDWGTRQEVTFARSALDFLEAGDRTQASGTKKSGRPRKGVRTSASGTSTDSTAKPPPPDSPGRRGLHCFSGPSTDPGTSSATPAATSSARPPRGPAPKAS
ncbi:transposase [Streptomyces sp. NPDC054949]